MGVSIIAAVLLSGCAGQGKKEDNRVTGDILFFAERQPDEQENSGVMMFVNDDYLYSELQASPGDYILFDRKKKTIYNVVSADKTIMVIESAPIPDKSPIDIQFKAEEQPSQGIPKYDGKQAVHYKLSANGKVCYNVVAIEGLLEPVRQAMTEFRLVLAGEHGKTVGSMPKDTLDACDLAINIFNADQILSYGFPMREWGSNGYQRFLSQVVPGGKINPENLTLPEDYKRYSVGE